MKKSVLVIIIVLSTVLSFNVYAEEGVDAKLDSLNAQVTSLTHDLDYLQSYSKISEIRNDLNRLYLEVTNQIQDMKINLHHKNIDRDLYASYSKLYDGYKVSLASNRKLDSKVREYIQLKMVLSNFSDDEKDMLHGLFDIIDDSYRRADMSLGLLKTCLDIYRKQL